MRILQLIFSIWGFFACHDFSVTLDMDCDSSFRRRYVIEYPFEFAEHICRKKSDNSTLFVSVDSSTGAQFFVTTAVLSLLYAIFIIFVYAYLDEMYKSKPEFPMAVSVFDSYQFQKVRSNANCDDETFSIFRTLHWQQFWLSSGWLELSASAAVAAPWKKPSTKNTWVFNVLSAYPEQAVLLTWVLLW